MYTRVAKIEEISNKKISRNLIFFSYCYISFKFLRAALLEKKNFQPEGSEFQCGEGCHTCKYESTSNELRFAVKRLYKIKLKLNSVANSYVMYQLSRKIDQPIAF